MPSTYATKRTGLCVGCRDEDSSKHYDIVIWESVDGNYYGTDFSEGSMDRVGACASIGEAMQRLRPGAINPFAWPT